MIFIYLSWIIMFVTYTGMVLHYCVTEKGEMDKFTLLAEYIMTLLVLIFMVFFQL